MKNVLYKGMMATAMLVAATTTATAAQLPAVDSVVTTTFDKSVIHGSLAHECLDGTTGTGPTCTGDLAYDKAGNARFVYTGKIYSVFVDPKTGELTDLDKHIGDISGEAAFPKMFVSLSTGVNMIMDAMNAGLSPTMPPMPPMPSVITWTCNHCDMTVAGTRYVSIADVLDKDSPMYNEDMAKMLDGKLADGSAGALDNMRMWGRAFTGLSPATFDPSTKTMGVRMAGCSALVAIEGPNAGKVGTLCMNATAVFDVSGTVATGEDPITHMPTYSATSDISAEGSSNCVTVLHTPTM